MFAALNVPAWVELEREPPEPAVEHFKARPGVLGYTWQVVDLRTGYVRSAGLGEAAAKKRAVDLNRAEP